MAAAVVKQTEELHQWQQGPPRWQSEFLRSDLLIAHCGNRGLALIAVDIACSLANRFARISVKTSASSPNE